MISVDLAKVFNPHEQHWFAASRGKEQFVVSGKDTFAIGKKLPPSSHGIPDGLFSEWTWNGEVLTAINDRYGISPLFYAEKPHGGIIVSTSIWPLLNDREVDTQLDYPALAVFLRMGQFIGDDTAFGGIRMLPPNSKLTWTPTTGLAIHREVSVITGSRANTSFDDAAERYNELLRGAIEKRLPIGNRYTVPLSGGRDSRHLLFELCAQGHKPVFCPTVQYRPPSSNEDIRIAAHLCEALNIKHQVIARCEPFFDALLKDVQIGELCSGGHPWALPLTAWLPEHTDTVYDGLAGDVLSAGFLHDQEKAQLFADGQLGQLARKILAATGSESALKSISNPNFFQRIDLDVAVQHLELELARHAECHNPLQSFIFWNRTRRGIGSLPTKYFAQVQTVHCPYLDHELFDFLTALDPKLTLDNRLHDAAILRGYPDLAHIPFENKSPQAPMSRTDRTYYQQALRQFAVFTAPFALGKRSLVRSQYLLARTCMDLMRREPFVPWYIGSATMLMSLERKSQH